MPRVESSVVINAEVDTVFAMAKNIEVFPEFMPDIKKVVILDRSADGNSITSEFTGYIKDFRITMKWVEKDQWDPQAKTCKFDLVKGDFKSYSGIWTFEPVDGGTKYTSVIDFEYEIPLIGPIIKTLVARLMKQNVENMLAAIKEKAEGK